ncbi:MAG: class II fumarate hydratase [bacterium]|nr:MAG: class II fumarate hydratase [bacterium]
MTKVRDSMGEMTVPDSAYYGASTQRAVENFPVSGYRIPRSILRALAMIKLAAARVNNELDLLEEEIADAVSRAADEVIEGRFDDQFPVDVFQTGSGTSTNMNMNEVIAARANEILGHPRQGRTPVHPNDHVNLGQSSNDVFPASLHIAARIQIQDGLIPAVKALKASLERKAYQFRDIVKVGRTHMQDAVPVTLGQEFSAWASQMEHGIEVIEAGFAALEEIPLGGTAVGTGLNTHPDFGLRAAARIADWTDIPFRVSANRLASLGGREALTRLSKALSAIASSLVKIASDIRFLASGPDCGIGEISLPALQPGSSIMPGKVNPVIIESAVQAATRVMGNDVTVTFANTSGNLELNVMMPLIGHSVMESVNLLTNVLRLLAEKCVDGIEANESRCSELVERSMALVTPLARKIGYDRAAELAKEARERGMTIREIVREKKILTKKEMEEILDPKGMV